MLKETIGQVYRSIIATLPEEHTPQLWVSGGSAVKLFDANYNTWQIELGASLETFHYIALVGNETIEAYVDGRGRGLRFETRTGGECTMVYWRFETGIPKAVWIDGMMVHDPRQLLAYYERDAEGVAYAIDTLRQYIAQLPTPTVYMNPRAIGNCPIIMDALSDS